MSINNANLANWIQLIYSKKIELMETADTPSSASFLNTDFKCETNDKHFTSKAGGVVSPY
jgi:hypothetical protein